MIIRDHWYVACPSSQLSQSALRGVQVGEDLLVVFRSSDGEPRALLDRCCHRGVRLSRGHIRNGRIACAYHGWEYEATGKLAFVPSLGEGSSPPAHEVPSFPAVEKDHYIWVWIAGESSEPTYQPAIRGLADGLWIQQTGIWKTNVMPAVENQLDVAHTGFAHPGIYPGHKTSPGERPPLRDLEFECRCDSESVVVFAPPRDDPSDSPPSPEKPEGGIGRFELPYRNYVFLAADGTRAIYNWVPLSEGSCRLEFMGYSEAARNGADEVEGRQVVFLEGEIELLSQDRLLLESAQHWLETGKGEYERSVASDVAPLMARKVVARALRGVHANSNDRRTQRRVFKCTC